MKNEYGKEKGYQGDKSYQASSQKSDNNFRKPNAPTQGGFSTPGGGHGQPLNKQQKNPQSNKTNPNTWGNRFY